MRFKHIFCIGLLLFCLALTSNAQLLWRISGKDLPGDSFLFGTNHHMAVDYCDSIPGFNDAFSSVVQSYFEVNGTEITSVKPDIMPFMPKGQTIATLYDEKEMEEILDYLAIVFGKRFRSINFTPYGLFDFIRNTLIGRVFHRDYGEDATMDLDLQYRAKAAGIPVFGLETNDFQMTLLYGNDLEKQASDLLEWIRSPESNPDYFVSAVRSFAKAYREEDLVSLNNFYSFDQSTQKAFRDDRNTTWYPIIIDAIKDCPTFIAVGVGHLPGEKGLLALLRKSGYTITPVQCFCRK